MGFRNKDKKKKARIRFDRDLFEVLDEKRSNPNQGIDEVLMDEFPELEEMVESGKKKDMDELF